MHLEWHWNATGMELEYNWNVTGMQLVWNWNATGMPHWLQITKKLAHCRWIHTIKLTLGIDSRRVALGALQDHNQTARAGANQRLPKKSSTKISK